MCADGRDAPELFLIDGNSLAYRAFFALPESIGTSDGRPTNAIFGLASMLVKIIDEHHPQGVIVAWDAGWSGREKTYDLYKAQRKPRPDLLREQWPHLMPLVEAFGYTNVKVEGFEADDVIASLARQAREQGIEVMVVTGDRDAYQLVGEGIRVMSTSRGITETKIYDVAAVEERYGVPPTLITDLMGLRGDTSDNIPGVPGIGEKTATQLLQKFGSLDKVLESVDEISGAKRKENLTNHADDARMSRSWRRCSTTSRPASTSPAALESEPDRGALRDFMREFELRAVMERLEEALPEGDAVPGRKVETELEIETVEATPADIGDGPRIALALDGDRWAAAEGERILTGESSHDELAVALADKPLAGHDLKSLGGGRHGLLAAAAREGVELGLEHDTMLAAYLLEPQRRTYELTELAADAGIGIAAGRRRRRRPRRTTGRCRSARRSRRGSTRPRRRASSPPSPTTSCRGIEALGLEPLMREVELPLIARPRGDGARGAEARRRAPRRGRRRLRRADRPAGEGHLRAGRRGVHDRLAAAGRPHPLREARADAASAAAKPASRPTPASSQQIRDEHPIVEKIESWRELTKLKNTYLDSLPDLIDPETGRVHTTFNQAATTTGRLSSTNPNLQNIPIRTEIGRPVRACFVAERGQPPALRRLQPGRAPRPRPRRRRAGAERRLPRRRRRPLGDRRRGLRDPPRRGRRRPALESENGQLRDRLRADRLRPRRPPQHPAQGGARNSSPATWSASPPCAASARRWSSAPRRRAT